MVITQTHLLITAHSLLLVHSVTEQYLITAHCPLSPTSVSHISIRTHFGILITSFWTQIIQNSALIGCLALLDCFVVLHRLSTNPQLDPAHQRGQKLGSSASLIFEVEEIDLRDTELFSLSGYLRTFF